MYNETYVTEFFARFKEDIQHFILSSPLLCLCGDGLTFPCSVFPTVHPIWQGPLAVPGGDRQSPIDIAVRKTQYDRQLKPLEMSYDPRTCQQIWNNGYSFIVEYDDTSDRSSKYATWTVSDHDF